MRLPRFMSPLIFFVLSVFSRIPIFSYVPPPFSIFRATGEPLLFLFVLTTKSILVQIRSASYSIKDESHLHPAARSCYDIYGSITDLRRKACLCACGGKTLADLPDANKTAGKDGKGALICSKTCPPNSIGSIGQETPLKEELHVTCVGEGHKESGTCQMRFRRIASGSYDFSVSINGEPVEAFQEQWPNNVTNVPFFVAMKSIRNRQIRNDIALGRPARLNMRGGTAFGPACDALVGPRLRAKYNGAKGWTKVVVVVRDRFRNLANLISLGAPEASTIRLAASLQTRSVYRRKLGRKKTSRSVASSEKSRKAEEAGTSREVIARPPRWLTDGLELRVRAVGCAGDDRVPDAAACEYEVSFRVPRPGSHLVTFFALPIEEFQGDHESAQGVGESSDFDDGDDDVTSYSSHEEQRNRNLPQYGPLTYMDEDSVMRHMGTSSPLWGRAPAVVGDTPFELVVRHE